MTDVSDRSDDGASPSQSDVYLSHLSAEDRAIFLRSSGGADLEADIRLMRTIITSLSSNLGSNHRHFGVLFNALCRAVGLQAKTSGGEREFEEALLQAAEDALRALESEAGQQASAAEGSV